MRQCKFCLLPASECVCDEKPETRTLPQSGRQARGNHAVDQLADMGKSTIPQRFAAGLLVREVTCPECGARVPAEFTNLADTPFIVMVNTAAVLAAEACPSHSGPVRVDGSEQPPADGYDDTIGIQVHVDWPDWTPEQVAEWEAEFARQLAVHRHRHVVLPRGSRYQPLSGPVTHIAGVAVQVGTRLRQRCSWCPAVLVDYDLTRVAVPAGQDLRPGTWEVGGLVRVDGGVSLLVEHEDGADLPDDACAVREADGE